MRNAEFGLRNVKAKKGIREIRRWGVLNEECGMPSADCKNLIKG